MAHKTNYSPESLASAIKLIKEAKNIMVRAQDFDAAALLRDAERILITKKMADDNRSI
jgi:protein-arginine kinase activator protein McsA